MKHLYLRKGRRRFPTAVAIATILALSAGTPAWAGEGKWTLQLEPMVMDAYGHDQHVLTVHDVTLGATPPVDHKTAYTLDTEAGSAFRAEVEYMKGLWGLGVDVFWFDTSQVLPGQSAASSGPQNEIVFEVADQQFFSRDPDDVLYFDILEDTSLVTWTVNLYGIKTLAEKPDSDLRLHFGLRVSDFDNDYRAAVGVEGGIASRLDASSNYGLMVGPMLGLAADVRHGKCSIKGFLRQAVILAQPELTGSSRLFFGPLSETTEYMGQETFRSDHDVAVPVTDLRLKGTYAFGKRLALGVGFYTSVWWDLPVPPGVVAVPGGDATLHENTVVFFGTLVALELTL